MMETLEDVLAHYGIKGMKWGVRRSDRELRRARRQKTSGPPSEDAKRASAAASKAKAGGISTLSNQELQQLNNRLNLEQQYNRLTTSEKKKKNAGSKFAQEFIANMGKEQANKFLKKHGPMMIKTAAGLLVPLDFTKIKI
jgi:hypothetical protein